MKANFEIRKSGAIFKDSQIFAVLDRETNQLEISGLTFIYSDVTSDEIAADLVADHIARNPSWFV